jgi:adenylylsulfate kinase
MSQVKRQRIIWFFGLSGAGKSTLCCSLGDELIRRGHQATILDGDRIRLGLCSDLGFSEVDRCENIRRIAHVANLFANTGSTVLVATISPLKKFRDLARLIVPDLIEVFVDAPLAICESRDPKGLYRQARLGQLSDFTGVDSPFEIPESPDLVCRTARDSVEECIANLLSLFELHETGLR